jgi:hypothetical protein
MWLLSSQVLHRQDQAAAVEAAALQVADLKTG